MKLQQPQSSQNQLSNSQSSLENGSTENAAMSMQGPGYAQLNALQSAANNSPQVNQLQALQHKANQSSQVQALKQVQMKASAGSQPVQMVVADNQMVKGAKYRNTKKFGKPESTLLSIDEGKKQVVIEGKIGESTLDIATFKSDFELISSDSSTTTAGSSEKTEAETKKPMELPEDAEAALQIFENQGEGAYKHLAKLAEIRKMTYHSKDGLDKYLFYYDFNVKIQGGNCTIVGDLHVDFKNGKLSPLGQGGAWIRGAKNIKGNAPSWLPQVFDRDAYSSIEAVEGSPFYHEFEEAQKSAATTAGGSLPTAGPKKAAPDGKK